MFAQCLREIIVVFVGLIYVRRETELRAREREDTAILFVIKFISITKHLKILLQRFNIDFTLQNVTYTNDATM